MGHPSTQTCHPQASVPAPTNRDMGARGPREPRTGSSHIPAGSMGCSLAGCHVPPP